MTKSKKSLGPVKRYSEELRRHIVKQIEAGKLTVLEAQREYEIGCYQSIYNWLYKYSRSLKKGTVLVVQKESEERKNQDLRKANKELEAALGRKQMEIDALYKLIEIASKELDVDLKKSFGDKPSKP